METSAVVLEIKNKIPITSLFDTVTKGRAKCILPGHKDDNPSVSVDVHRNTARCWVCNESGSVIDWYMKSKQLTLAETISQLSKQIGIFPQPPTQRIKLWNDAVSIWRRELKQNVDVFRYALARGISEEVIFTHQLGYNAKDSLKKEMEYTELVDAGLMYPKGQEYFANRLMFPFKDFANIIVQAQGRYLGNDDFIKQTKKYIHGENNTKLGSINISNYLFGQQLLTNSKYAFLCEGPLDACNLLSWDICAVGLVGNKNLYKHYEKFQNLETLYITLDYDKATQKSLLFELIKLQSACPNLNIININLPFDLEDKSKGKDIADYCKLYTKEHLRELTTKSPTVIELAYNAWINDEISLNTLLAMNINEEYIKLIAHKLKVSIVYVKGRIDGVTGI